MNDKIDVLAVMESDAAAAMTMRAIVDGEGTEVAARQRSDAARAAIAELIYVAKDARDSLLAANKVYSDGAIGLLIERLSAALESVGGA